MKYFSYFFIIAIAIPPLWLPAQTSNHISKTIPDRYAIVDGHKMHYQTAGAGAITVVFENGHSDPLDTWDKSFPMVAGFARVFRYDRMGAGSSEQTTATRSLKQVAMELHELLRVAKIPPPYILVGHSLGGAFIRGFANQYSDETKGLIFIDPFTEFTGRSVSDEMRRQYSKTGDSVMQGSPSTVLAEWEFSKNEYLNNYPELNSIGTFPDIPMALLVAGKSRFINWENDLVDLYKTKMHDLSESRLIVLAKSDHHIHNYDPDLVIECIHDVVYSAVRNILQMTLRKNGADSCIARYKKMRASTSKDVIVKETIFNFLGYEMLNKGDANDAIKLFALNATLFPESANVYDSLGEAYMDAGNTKEAIGNYNRSLALNPGNTNAKRMLDKLK